MKKPFKINMPVIGASVMMQKEPSSPEAGIIILFLLFWVIEVFFLIDNWQKIRCFFEYLYVRVRDKINGTKIQEIEVSEMPESNNGIQEKEVNDHYLDAVSYSVNNYNRNITNSDVPASSISFHNIPRTKIRYFTHPMGTTDEIEL